MTRCSSSAIQLQALHVDIDPYSNNDMTIWHVCQLVGVAGMVLKMTEHFDSGVPAQRALSKTFTGSS